MPRGDTRGAGLLGAAADLGHAERRALGALDLDGLIAFLRELIAIPSLDGDETRAQSRVAAWMEAAGLHTDLWAIDLEELGRHPDWCHEVEREGALGLVGWLGEPARPEAGEADERGGHGGRTALRGRDLLLNGHIDVVPVGDESAWATPPWASVVREGRVYGRGAVDMKGGLVCALFAVKAIHDAGVRLCGRLSVASVVGEEDGGTGTLATILRGHAAHGAVVMEPTELAVIPAQAGSLMFRLIVPGRAAHGCVREEGVNAIEKFLPLFLALRQLEAERCGAVAGAADVAGDPHSPLFARYRLPWPIELGTVRAGDWASSVPDELIAEGRLGVAIGEEPAAARKVLEEAIARASATDSWLAEHPAQVEWWGGRFDPAVTDPADPIVGAVVEAATAVTGAAPRIEGVTYGADMRLLVNVGGIPTVLFGPGDVRVAHRPDEHVPIDELRVAAQTLILTALRFCGFQE
ncbi:MAG: ArgE/DapE family deacylase [Actinobacteria bacterium]|nr:ArgE/DapE family deacylase [Actinomycetota bacterium]